MDVKISTILYAVATVVFILGALALGGKAPLAEIGLALVAAGLTVGSVGR